MSIALIADEGPIDFDDRSMEDRGFGKCGN